MFGVAARNRALFSSAARGLHTAGSLSRGSFVAKVRKTVSLFMDEDFVSLLFTVE